MNGNLCTSYIVTLYIKIVFRNFTQLFVLLHVVRVRKMSAEKEGIDTSAMESELLLSVMSSLAESESRSISENTKWSFGRQFRNGTFKRYSPRPTATDGKTADFR